MPCDWNKKTRFKPMEKHWKWNGGKMRTKEGYIKIRISKHNYVSEHILVIERSIGRKLKREEVVHHINMVRDDNRIENLQLMTRSDHCRLHITGKKTSEKTRESLRKSRKGTNSKEEHSQWKYDVTRADVVRAVDEFKTQKEAAKYLGVCADTLRARLKHYGLYKKH